MIHRMRPIISSAPTGGQKTCRIRMLRTAESALRGNASSNMRMGLSPAIQLDGLHLLFRNLNVTGENARLSLILADAAQKRF